MYIFIILKQCIDIETPITLVVFIKHCSCRGDFWFASVYGFFLQKYCLSQGIRILQLEKATNLVTKETSLSSADSYTS